MSPVYVVFLCVVVTVLGETPEPCCVPKSWQAVMTNTSLINSDDVDFSYYYIDYSLKKDALVHMVIKPNSTAEETYRIVKDYNKFKMYEILPNGKCYSFNYPLKMFSQCVPKSATYLGGDYVGLPNAGTPYDAWRFTEQNIKVTVAVSKGSCVPLIQGIKGAKIDSVLFFSHYTFPVMDPSVFKVPPGC